MWPTSTLPATLNTLLYTSFQSLKRDVAYFHLRYGVISESDTGSFQSLKRDVAYFHVLTIVYFGLQFAFQSLKRDVAYFHPLLYPLPRLRHRRFNRSSAMWPTSTYRRLPGLPSPLRVSIAQARCGLLPHTLEHARRFLIRTWFQSLKRDVAYFHSSALEG